MSDGFAALKGGALVANIIIPLVILGCNQEDKAPPDNSLAGQAGAAQCEASDNPPEESCQAVYQRPVIFVSDIHRCPISPLKVASGCSSDESTQAKIPSYLQDECGCLGKSCGEGLTCAFARKDMGGSGNRVEINQCLPGCSGDKDCAADEICISAFDGYYNVPVCHKADCKSDADCQKDGDCGRCVIETEYRTQSFYNFPLPAKCKKIESSSKLRFRQGVLVGRA